MFFNLVCESCIEPVPLCNEGEILTVDLHTIHYCCPHYYCGECDNCRFNKLPDLVKMTVCVCGYFFDSSFRVGFR